MLRIACLLLALAVSMAVEAQQSSARDSFAAGSAAFTDEDYLRALSLFQAARDAGLPGPAVDYNIAVSHYKLGNYEQAGAEFRLIVERYPAMRALAQYNLGLVAQRLGQPTTAESYFRQALANAEDEKIRALAARQLDEGEQVASAVAVESTNSANRWYSLLNARLGNDDNVRLISDEVPVPAGLEAESSVTEFTAFVTGPLSAEPGLRFDGSFYASRYGDASFFDQNYLSAGLVYQWQPGQWRAEAGPHLSHSTLDGDSYEQRLGMTIGVRRSLSSTLSFGTRFVHDEVDSGSSQFAFLDGSRDWIEVRIDRTTLNGRLTASYSIESSDRGATIATSRNRLLLRYRYSFTEHWLATVTGSLRQSSYDDLATPRDEDLKDLTFELTRNLSRNWAVTAFLSTADNDAPTPFDYERTRFSVGIGKTFY
jgi:tetratricopeptide (TPR) repeat protein